MRGERLAPPAHDDGFLHPGRVRTDARVAVLGHPDCVPVRHRHVSAPVPVRGPRERGIIWRDTVRLAEHARAPAGAQRRIVDSAHCAPRFGGKVRAQVMRYRAALLELGEGAARSVSEVSRRPRARLRAAVRALPALVTVPGVPAVRTAMAQAERVAGDRAADGVALRAAAEVRAHVLPPPPRLTRPGVPPQGAIDRQLSHAAAAVQRRRAAVRAAAAAVPA